MVTLLAVLFAVFAIFAMHGLASHELAHGGSAATALPVVGVDDGQADGDHVHATTAPDDKGAGERSPDQGHDLGSGACLALLCLLGGLLALVLRRGLHARPCLVPRSITGGLFPRGRPADPPCLHRLSILRC